MRIAAACKITLYLGHVYDIHVSVAVYVGACREGFVACGAVDTRDVTLQLCCVVNSDFAVVVYIAAQCG